MASSSAKRPRSAEEEEETNDAILLWERSEDAPAATFFAPLVAWVTARGGWVHPALAYRDRTLVATTALAAGTVVLRSPVITAASHPEDETAEAAAAEHALAWYLASQPDDLQPYLASLPERAPDLPRDWPPHVQAQLLTGSPVLHDVVTMSAALRAQYHAAACASSSNAAPSWEAYSCAHALVTSRAFEGSSNSGTLCLVPILDLCNHRRGAVKQLAYRIGTDGSMEVTTGCAMAPDTALHITYGAKSNAVLLVQYGFCLPPEEASNDVWKFDATTVLRTGTPADTYGGFVTAWQSFCAEDEKETAARAHDGEEDEEENVEDFLDACDAEETDDDEGDEDDDDDHADDSYQDLLYQASGPSFTEAVRGKTRIRTTQQELEALQKFHQHLLQRAEAYTLPQQANWSELLLVLEDDSGAPSREVYAARLIYSELRLLQWYLEATARLAQRLDPSTLIGRSAPRLVPLTPEDARTMDQQIAQLMDVVLQLRPVAQVASEGKNGRLP